MKTLRVIEYRNNMVEMIVRLLLWEVISET